MNAGEIIEHGESRSDRRLRVNRLRIAVGIAVVEGIVVLAGGIPWWVTAVLALLGVAAYLGFGREHAQPRVRAITWIAAVSQLIVVLVPALVAVAVALAVVTLVLVALALLVALLLDRR